MTSYIHYQVITTVLLAVVMNYVENLRHLKITYFRTLLLYFLKCCYYGYFLLRNFNINEFLHVILGK